MVGMRVMLIRFPQMGSGYWLSTYSVLMMLSRLGADGDVVPIAMDRKRSSAGRFDGVDGFLVEEEVFV